MRASSLLVLLLAVACTAHATKLDDYVNKPDPAYSWTDLEHTIRGDGWIGHLVNMTSQSWLTPTDWSHQSRPEAPNVWWHKLIFIVPDSYNRSRSDTGIVYITGGNNNNPASLPDANGQDAILLGAICAATGVRGLVLYQVPNQPVFFHDEVPRKGRSEDALIALTWNRFIHHEKDAEWLARFPMTKAAVRAMDTMTAFSSLAKVGGAPISKFIVAGASKRGWTTWTTAAVDKRVIAFVPMVMDLLNVVENTRAHYQALNGGYSFAFGDYYSMGITADLDHPNTKQLELLVDGYHYRERYAGRPFLMIVSSGDQFFLPQDTHYFWRDMPKPTSRMLMMPNAEHSMITAIPQAVNAVNAFVNAVCDRYPQPVFDWKIDPITGDISIRNTPQLPGEQGRPIRVQYWWAQSAKNTGRRDWRLMAGNPPDLQLVLWANQTVPESSERNVWVAKMPKPAQDHWMAMFVSLQYTGPRDAQGRRTVLDYTTECSIWPTTQPQPPCRGEECRGVLK